MRKVWLFSGLFVFFVSVFVCFYRNDGSFWRGDESLFVLATQGMMDGGNWWYPNWNNKPFFMKPPLKLWLNAIVVSLFGESNSAYRTIDGLSGIGILLITFLAGHRLFGSLLAGLLAWGFLIGSYGWIFVHGPRYGSMDCLLLLLTTIAILAGAQVPRLIRAGRSGWQNSLLLGIATGLAIMTKSAAGLMPLIVLAIVFLINRDWGVLIDRGWKQMLVVLALAVLIPAPYFVWHSLYSHGAYATLILQDIVGRVNQGYFGQENRLFYWDLIFVKERLVPALVLVAGLIWAIAQFFSNKDERREPYGLLLVWAILPPTLMSFSSTRINWYISACFPALALLCGGVTAAMIKSVVRPSRWFGNRFGLNRAARFGLLVMSLMSIGLMLHNQVRVGKIVLAKPKRIELDEISRELTYNNKKGDYQGFVFRPGGVGYSEIPYWNKLRRVAKFGVKQTALNSGLELTTARYGIFPLEFLPLVTSKRKIATYRLLPPREFRTSWFCAVQFANSDGTPVKPLKGFRTLTRTYNLPENPEIAAYGWAAEKNISGSIPFRAMIESRAGIHVSGDKALRTLGATAELIASSFHGQELKIYLNAVEITSIALKASPGFSRYNFNIPADIFAFGTNMVTIQLVDPIVDSPVLVFALTINLKT